MPSFRSNDVFVPGGMPKLTYVPREARNLEERLKAARDNLCKLVTVTGATKSGKTVLTNRVFPQAEHIWVDGGTIKEEDDLWNFVLQKIDGYNATGSTLGKETESTITGEIGAKAGIPLLGKGEGKVGASYGKNRTSEITRSLTLNPRAAAISQLREVNRALIIDDFHYLAREFQGNIIRALKPLIFAGIPVILIAIPHRRYDAVKVEREITGRLETIEIPPWGLNELIKIPREGFPLLNIEIPENFANQLANESCESPHLMQDFCRNLTKVHGVMETSAKKIRVETVDANLFHGVAETTGKVMFEKLASGPFYKRRMQRRLKTGGTADIYKMVLYALSRLHPALQTLAYRDLRAAFRDVLADDEHMPKDSELIRVLEFMAEIASHDEASTPVIDWVGKEKKLHITDPFFAFYLKWGALVSSASHLAE